MAKTLQRLPEDPVTCKLEDLTGALSANCNPIRKKYGISGQELTPDQRKYSETREVVTRLKRRAKYAK